MRLDPLALLFTSKSDTAVPGHSSYLYTNKHWNQGLIRIKTLHVNIPILRSSILIWLGSLKITLTAHECSSCPPALSSCIAGALSIAEPIAWSRRTAGTNVGLSEPGVGPNFKSGEFKLPSVATSTSVYRPGGSSTSFAVILGKVNKSVRTCISGLFKLASI